MWNRRVWDPAGGLIIISHPRNGRAGGRLRAGAPPSPNQPTSKPTDRPTDATAASGPGGRWGSVGFFWRALRRALSLSLSLSLNFITRVAIRATCAYGRLCPCSRPAMVSPHHYHMNSAGFYRLGQPCFNEFTRRVLAEHPPAPARWRRWSAMRRLGSGPGWSSECHLRLLPGAIRAGFHGRLARFHPSS